MPDGWYWHPNFSFYLVDLPRLHSSPIFCRLKHDSLLWYAVLHQEQLRATISLELNESLDWNDCKKRIYLVTAQNTQQTECFHHTLSTASLNVLKCVVFRAYLLLLLKPYHVTFTEGSTHQPTLANCTPWQYQPNHILCLTVTDISEQICTSSIPLSAWIGPELLQEVEAPTISRQSAHDGGKVISPMYRPPLPPWRYPRYSFLSWVG